MKKIFFINLRFYSFGRNSVVCFCIVDSMRQMLQALQKLHSNKLCTCYRCHKRYRKATDSGYNRKNSAFQYVKFVQSVMCDLSVQCVKPATCKLFRIMKFIHCNGKGMFLSYIRIPPQLEDEDSWVRLTKAFICFNI